MDIAETVTLRNFLPRLFFNVLVLSLVGLYSTCHAPTATGWFALSTACR
jgi:hypothetical protein